MPSCFVICAYLKFLWWWLILWELPSLTVLWDVQLHPLSPHTALMDGDTGHLHWAPQSVWICVHPQLLSMERRQQQVWLSPGHQKNAATSDALIYARQCLTTKIAFSTESTLKFNAVFAWQCSRPHDHCNEIQHPLAQQGSHLLQAHCWHPGLKGSLENTFTQAPGWPQTSPLWQGRFLAEQTRSEHTKPPWHWRAARPLSQCCSYHPPSHNWVNPPQVDTPATAIRTTFLDQLAVAQAINSTMAKLFCISHFSQYREL